MNSKELKVFFVNKLTTADTSQSTLLAHLHFFNAKADAKNAKEPAIFPFNQHDRTLQDISGPDLPAPNSTLAIGGISSPLDSFVVAESSVLRTNFCAKKPDHRQSANRYLQRQDETTQTTTQKRK